jgi:hypothetical protein
MKTLKITCLLVYSIPFLYAQTTPTRIQDRLSTSVYAVMNYNRYQWQILPAKRHEVQFERAVLETSFRVDKKWNLNAELEFENGGTGVSLEFDPLEEFGEFEYEVEKGGEIWFEQFNLQYAPSKSSDIRFGRVKVPFGIMTVLDEPTEYRTTGLSEMEDTVLPTHWSEYGVLSRSKIADKWLLQVGMVSALDGSAFNSANFIKRGNQRRFETVKVNDWAGVARLDYVLGEERFVGISGYVGNTRNNRPKPDLQVDAYLAMAEAHVVLEAEPFEFQAIGLVGHLQNSEQVSNANRNLSNNLNVKRTPVGKEAVGASAELAFELYEMLKKHPKGELYLFARYDYVDTHFATQGSVFNNPRWERSTWTTGVNVMPNNWLIFKAQFARQKLGISTQKFQNTFSLGFGFHLK